MLTLLKRGFRPLMCLIISCLLMLTFMPVKSEAMPVFINELHYDNSGADVGEGVELAGVAGANLAGWRLLFYNGGNGQSYRTVNLTGVFADQQQGYGVLAFAVSGIQNGAADGIALVDASNQLQQFISYEGVFTASAGIAANRVAEDIGVAENALTPVGSSLQLTGTGLSQFQWLAASSSFGAVNAGQQFTAPPAAAINSVPILSSCWLLVAGLTGGVLAQRRKI